MAASATSLEYVQKMFLAYFGRPVAPTGQDYYASLVDAGNVAALQDDFWNSAESQGVFGSLSTEGKVNAIFQQLFGRDAALSGLTYWATEINAGRVSLPSAALTILNSAADADLATFNAKLSVAEAFTAALDTSTEVLAYQSNTDGGRNLLVGITDQTQADATVADIDTAVAAVVEGGQSNTGQTLTISSDLVSGTGADEIIGGLVGTNPQTGALADTLQSVDIINGGEGTDTLNASIASATAAVAPTITGVENINFTAFVAQAFNMANVSGTTKVVNTGSIVTAQFTNVASQIDLGVTDVNNQITQVSYAAAVNTGLTDEMDVSLNNVTNEAEITLTGANTIETLNLATTGAASKVDIGGTAAAGATKIVVTGDQTLSFDDTDGDNAMTAVKTFDSSASTGKVDADLRNSATNITVTMGATDDTLTLAGVTKDDSINMGDGADKLNIRVADAETNTSAITLTGVETIAFALNTDNDDSEDDSTFNLSGATSLTTISVGASTAATVGNEQQITVTQLGSTFTTLSLNGDGAAADESLNDVVLTYASSAVSGTSDALTVNVSNKDASGNLINSTKGVQLNGSVTANSIENITINTDKLHADTDATTQDGGVELTLAGDKLTKLTVVSETLVDLNAAALDDNVNTIDASAASGGVIVDLDNADDAGTTTAASKTLTVTMGAGNDTVENIDETGSGFHTYTISMGAGNDTLTWGDGAGGVSGTDAATIDLGAGNDTLDMSTTVTVAADITYAVTMGDGVDTIKLLGDGTQTGITISDFVVGVGGDKIDMATNSSNNGTAAMTAYLETTGSTGDNITSGMIVYTGGNATSLSIADVVTALNTKLQGDTTDNNEAAYIIVGDGSSAGLYYYLESDTTAAIAAGDLTHLVTFTGVTDVSKFAVDNFTDFLA